jgi:hypothetical protein
VDVSKLEVGAISSDNDDFLITEPGQHFHGIVQPFGEGNSCLSMDRSQLLICRMEPGGEQMGVKVLLLLRTQTVYFKQVTEAPGPAAPGALDVRGFSEDK